MNSESTEPLLNNLQTIFHAIPGNHLILLPDAPTFTIVGATDVFLKISYNTREKILGRPLFEIFPDDTTNEEATGELNLRSSLEYVIACKEVHHMADQRYDIVNPQTGGFEFKVWAASNKPILGTGGDIQYIIHTTEDITEKVRLQEENTHRLEQLNESESRFRRMVEQAPVPILLSRGEEVVIESLNEPMLRLMNKTSVDEVIGKMMVDSLPELKDQPVLQIVKQVQKTGEPFRGDEIPTDVLIEGKLERFYFNYSYTPLIEADEITGVLHVALDITPQVTARKKIEESEVRFRTMAESTPVLVAMTNETGNAIYFNKAWTDVTGRPMQELLDYGWVDLLHPEDRERFLKIYLDAFAVKGPFAGELRVLHPQGHYRCLLAHGAPRFDTEGSFVGFISACTDITEHKKVQQELKTALEQVRLSKEAAELGTFDMDLEKGTMHWDDRCRILFGITHHNPVRFEKDFAGGLHPNDRQRVLEVIERLYDKSISNGDYDVEYRTVGAEDAVVRWVRAKGKVYFSKEDKPVRFIGSVLDITEKVMALQKIEGLVEERTKELAQANETLHKINRELQRSNQNLEEFAHAASHDLKEPIRKIHFFTHQLKNQLSTHLKETELRSFNRIENATERMGNLIDDLLLYSHVSHRPHQTESVDLNEKIQRVLEDLELDIQETGAVITVQKLPVVQGYKRQLQQLFQNLISNAIKYSKADVPPQINIAADQVEKDGRHYHRITVQDDGIGFQPEYADKIFQMFTRLHEKNEYSGTGVGLSIVKKVVENHNGCINVESTPGLGSTFIVLLPME